ncbi:BlaI/MecI/CopY family transcriptional regulator [Rhodococcus xishaensis]|uniref:Transcriptional regulator n=1 Tax=Rhodococcus xishaensis TaxID=2487364 RepID=A0A3S3AGR8_9NOCA|nr:BlaI/MecI/CopY family transcriptional regulator [Rhodococcus xishaensis]RVW04240.1 transcriptional regulator [Rhodococcus xishaensis]
MAGLGELERAVMDHLWSVSEPQTVRQVHEALAARRELAYTTVMTVLQRLAKKHLVIQQRDDRAHRYVPVHGRDELVASLMVDALQQADESGERAAALVHFVGQVGADEAAALREALAALEESEATKGETTSQSAAPMHPPGSTGLRRGTSRAS